MSRLAQVAMRAKAVSSASGEGCVGPGGVDLSSAQSIWSELDKIPQEGTFILADIGKFIAENKCFNLLESAGMYVNPLGLTRVHED